MTSRLTRDIFITKDAIWGDMLPPLLILFKYELGSWTKFISWNFLYQRTCLSWRTLLEKVCCFFYLFCLRKKKLCKLEIDPWLLMTQSSNRSSRQTRTKFVQEGKFVSKILRLFSTLSHLIWIKETSVSLHVFVKEKRTKT